MQVMYGKHITAAADPLHRVELERVMRGIRQPKPTLRDRIEQLRTVASVDVARYRELKKGLPYVVCGIFHPAIRRREHFATIEGFLLDLDHLSEHAFDPARLSEKMSRLPQPMAGFLSPGGDGLKLLFRLSEPCRDESRYRSFYKLFATRFAREHSLEQVVDYQTCDVTRACFLSYDPNAFYRPDAEAVVMDHYLAEELSLPVREELREAERVIRQSETTAAPTGPDADTLEQIRRKLNPGRRPKKRPDVIQPERIREALAYFEEHLQTYALSLEQSEPINYGRKLRLAAAGGIWCELNLFYGKRGFTVVKTTKSGSNAELATLAASVLSELLYDRFEDLQSKS